MTDLKKKVERRTASSYSILYSGRPLQVVVGLVPHDLLEFRESGRRGRWQLAIADAFRFAVRARAEAERRERRGARSGRGDR